MGAFDLDFSHLRAVVAPDRIPLRGNEHRIARIAFDLFRLDEDKENLWQVQADDDGNEFLVRTYELPKEELQAKSDWSVVEDGRKASLTVSYHGMPVHRIVASDYGASVPGDVVLLRDLLRARLADDRFACRFLMSLPEPKRAALAAAFPKIAAALPKIPLPTGNDPLEGIEPVDPREYSPPTRNEQPLPPPGDWEKHPQNAEDEPGESPDIWRAQAFESDMGRPALRKEAKEIIPKVLAYLRSRPGKKVSLHTLYMDLDVNDVPLYMALHALVKGGLVQGVSPYDTPSPEMAAITGQPDMGHGDLFYSVGGSKLQNADR